MATLPQDKYEQLVRKLATNDVDSMEFQEMLDIIYERQAEYYEGLSDADLVATAVERGFMSEEEASQYDNSDTIVDTETA